MQITEAKIRQISEEALCQLGPNANPEMLKKVVKEVVRRLAQESNPTSRNQKEKTHAKAQRRKDIAELLKLNDSQE